jgi:hypothetical protein
MPFFSVFAENIISAEFTKLTTDEISKKQSDIQSIDSKLAKLDAKINKLTKADPQKREILERKKTQLGIEAVENRIALKQDEIYAARKRGAKKNLSILQSELQALRRQHQKLNNKELRYVRAEYNEHILKGKPDPYKHLMKIKLLNAVSGPKGSNLYALVKIPTVDNKQHEKSRYRSFAQGTLNANETLKQQVRQVAKSQGHDIIFAKNRNPVLVKSDGSQVRLIWHHSPNHIGTVSLIPDDTHRQIKARLHYGKYGKGGADMFSTIDPETKTAMEAAKVIIAKKKALKASVDAEIKKLQAELKIVKKKANNAQEARRIERKLQELRAKSMRLKAATRVKVH